MVENNDDDDDDDAETEAALYLLCQFPRVLGPCRRLRIILCGRRPSANQPCSYEARPGECSMDRSHDMKEEQEEEHEHLLTEGMAQTPPTPEEYVSCRMPCNSTFDSEVQQHTSQATRHNMHFKRHTSQYAFQASHVTRCISSVTRYLLRAVRDPSNRELEPLAIIPAWQHQNRREVCENHNQ